MEGDNALDVALKLALMRNNQFTLPDLMWVINIIVHTQMMHKAEISFVPISIYFSFLKTPMRMLVAETAFKSLQMEHTALIRNTN